MGYIQINQLNGKVFVFFTSLYCAHCIDLLPHLKEINEIIGDSTLLLSSDGNTQEIQEMVNYFKWTFPIVRIEERFVKNYYPDVKFPFMLALDKRKMLQTAGTIYNKEDFIIVTKTITYST